MTFQRDPVSVRWDAAAARMLQRAYEAKGEWAASRLADPTPVQHARFYMMGIDVNGPDNASTMSGKRDNARSRWCRGFVRSVYYQNKGGRPVEVEIGRHMPAVGTIPAGRAVRMRILRGGSVAQRAVRRKGEDARIFADDGRPAGRWSDPARRDW